jgi:hypothetical protein
MLDPKVPYLGGFTPKIAEKSQIGLKLVVEKIVMSTYMFVVNLKMRWA